MVLRSLLRMPNFDMKSGEMSRSKHRQLEWDRNNLITDKTWNRIYARASVALFLRCRTGNRKRRAWKKRHHTHPQQMQKTGMSISLLHSSQFQVRVWGCDYCPKYSGNPNSIPPPHHSSWQHFLFDSQHANLLWTLRICQKFSVSDLAPRTTVIVLIFRKVCLQ